MRLDLIFTQRNPVEESMQPSSMTKVIDLPPPSLTKQLRMILCYDGKLFKTLQTQYDSPNQVQTAGLRGELYPRVRCRLPGQGKRAEKKNERRNVDADKIICRDHFLDRNDRAVLRPLALAVSGYYAVPLLSVDRRFGLWVESTVARHRRHHVGELPVHSSGRS